MKPENLPTEGRATPDDVCDELLTSLLAQNQNLQLLVGELLVANQQLRRSFGYAGADELTAPATHPPRRQDH